MPKRKDGFGNLGPAGWTCFWISMLFFSYGMYGFSHSKVGRLAFHLFATTAHAATQSPRVTVSCPIEVSLALAAATVNMSTAVSLCCSFVRHVHVFVAVCSRNQKPQ